jgi:hypothetical protein
MIQTISTISQSRGMRGRGLTLGKKPLILSLWKRG